MELSKFQIFGMLKERGLDTKYADDLWNKQQIRKALENDQLDDTVRSTFEGLNSTGINFETDQPGAFTSQLSQLASQYDSGEDGSATSKLRQSISNGFDISKFYRKGSINTVGDIFDSTQAPELPQMTTQQPEEEKYGFFMGNIWGSLENSKGFAKLLGGMAASGLGVESLGEALKASAMQNFEQSKNYAKDESFEEDPLAWAGQVIIQQIPDIALTLVSGGAAGLAAGGVKMLGGQAAKKVVKESLKDALTKGLVGKEGAEAIIAHATRDEVIDAVTSVGLRDAFTAKGRKAFAGEAVNKMGFTGVSREALEDAVLKGARGRALTSTSTAAAAGSFTWGALTTDGDIAKDLYDEAGRLREARVQQLVESGLAEPDAIVQAKKEITDPTLGDLGVGGFIAPMTDMFVPYVIGKQLGIFKGSKVSSVARELATTDAGKKILKSLPAAIAKGAVPEGFTEMVQGAMAESAKKDFIDQWKTMGLTKEQELGWVDYMLRDEAKARYLAEFAGGALMGGVMGGIANKVEGWRDGKPDAEPKVEGQPEAPAAETEMAEYTPEKGDLLTNIKNYKDELVKNGGFSLAEVEQRGSFKKSMETAEAREKAGVGDTKTFKDKKTGAQKTVARTPDEITTAQEKLAETVGKEKEVAKSQYLDDARIDGSKEIANAETAVTGIRNELKSTTDVDLIDILKGDLAEAEKNLVDLQTKYEWSKPIREINRRIRETEVREIPQSTKDKLIAKLTEQKMKLIEDLSPEQAVEMRKFAQIQRDKTISFADRLAAIEAELKVTPNKPATRVRHFVLQAQKDFLTGGDIDSILKTYNMEVEAGLLPDVANAATDEQLDNAGLDVQAIRDLYATKAEAEPVVTEAAPDVTPAATTVEQQEENRNLPAEYYGEQVPVMQEPGIDLADTSPAGRQRVVVALDQDAVRRTLPSGQRAVGALPQTASTPAGFFQMGESEERRKMRMDAAAEGVTALQRTFDIGRRFLDMALGIKRMENQAATDRAAQAEVARFGTTTFRQVFGFDPGAIKDRQQQVLDDVLDYADYVEGLPFGTLQAMARKAGWLGEGGRNGAEQFLVGKKVDGIRALAAGTVPKGSFSRSGVLTSDRRVEVPTSEQAQVVEEAPVVEQEPAVVTAPVVEQAPVVETAPVVELAPVVEEAPRRLVIGPRTRRATPAPATPAPTQTTPAAPVVSNRKTDPRKPRTPVTARAIDYLDASDADPESQTSDDAANEFRKTLTELKAREGLEVSDAEAINTLVDRGVLDVTRQDRARLQNLVTKFALPTADQVTQGTTIEQLKSWLSSNQQGFLKDADIKVVTSEQFPGKKWQGAYRDGVIYINADTMTEADMKRVLFHESLGHAIARKVLGKDYDSVMKTILREMQAVIAGGKDVMVGNTSMKDLINTYKDKLNDPQVAEEVWAKYIEAHAEGKLTNRSTLFKIWEAIRNWIREAMGRDVTRLGTVDALAARAVRRAEFNQIDMSDARMGSAMARANLAQLDRDYLAAVEAGDTATAQKLVDEAAKMAGYDIQNVYHASSSEFNQFLTEQERAELAGEEYYGDEEPGNLGTGFYFTPDLGYAKRFGKPRKFHLKISNMIDVTNDEIIRRGREIQEEEGGMTNGQVMDELIKEDGADGAFGESVGGLSYGASEYMVVSSSQAKSADPVTYDDNGNVIPLSERFNQGTDDIRYSLVVERPKATPVTDERATRDASRILGIKLPRMFLESKLLGEVETAFKKTDVNWFDKLLRPSQWIAEKMFQEVPQLRRMFQVLTNMSDRHREIFNQLSFHALPYLKASKTDKIAVEKVLVQGDIDGVEYTTAQEAKLTAEQFKQYQSARTALNKARDHMVADAERAIKAMEERIKGQENIAPIIQKQIDELKSSVASLKKMKGYIPRVRPDSAPYDIQYMLDGKIHSEFIDVKGTPGIRVAERRIKELVAKGAQPIGGKDKIEVLERPANYYDQSSLSPTEIGELSNILASVMKDKDGKSLEGVDDLLKSLFYAKGFKKHYIRRQKAKLSKDGIEIATGSSETELDNGTTVIHGYQTDNLDVVLKDYFQGLAGQSAKSETSMKLMEIFEERDADGKLVFDPANPKRIGAYAKAKEFLKAAKMAGNEYSKTVRRINTIQFHAHIGLRFSSALWNMTHIHMFGSGLLRTEMMKAGKKNTPSFLDMSKQFAVAHKDAMVFVKAIKPKLETTADAKVTLEEMGWGQDKAKVLDALNQYFAAANGSTLSEQLYSESFGKDAGVPQSMMAQYAKYSGWMMHHSELANKLASFQMHYQNMGGNYDEAKHFVRLLNGSYEKFNMPGYLQGEGLTSAAAQIMLNTFRTHVLNTYEIMGAMWKYDKAAFAYSMGAATIMAGVPGKMMLDMLIRLIWGVSEGEDQFKGSYERMNEDLFGPGVAKFMKGGVANWMDFVDPSASIGISQHPAVDALSYLTGHNREIALAAPVTGFIKAMNGEAPAYKLMPIKGIQSIWQGLSDSNQVQIGSRKIFNSDGTPMKLAPWESALVALGLNPARRAQTSTDIWEDYQVNEFFSSWKSSILNDAKEARSLYERAEVNKQMQEFNDQLAVVKRNPTYSNVVKAKPVRWADTKRARGEYTKTERGQ